MARPRARREVEAGGRARLLAAAMRLFATKGYAGTSVRDILKAAEVTAPALYYHFGSKEGLFLALAREGVQRSNAARQEALEGEVGAIDRIRRYCLAIVAVRREFAELAWVVEAILTGPPEAAPRFDFRGELERMFRQLEGLIRQGIETGELRRCDPTRAAVVLLGLIEVASRLRLAEIVGLTLDAEVEGALSVILEGLGAPPE
jgi:TetR/AcrR family transcriptional regulator